MSVETVRKSYDIVAEDYAERFWNELEGKHFDRLLLDWFATQISPEERVLEIGAGPAEVSGYLTRRGVRCVATDASPQMVACARRLFPNVSSEVMDFFKLGYPDQSFRAVVAFYAIVNYPLARVAEILAGAHRVLRTSGLFLFSFHILDQQASCEVNRFLDHEIEGLTFHFFEPDAIKDLAEGLGFKVIDLLIRYPYPEVEYQSKRAYVLLTKR